MKDDEKFGWTPLHGVLSDVLTTSLRLQETLTRTQGECTRLLLENRRLTVDAKNLTACGETLETIAGVFNVCDLFRIEMRDLPAKIEEIRAENKRLAYEASQCHKQNMRLVSERMDLKKKVRDLEARDFFGN